MKDIWLNPSRKNYRTKKKRNLSVILGAGLVIFIVIAAVLTVVSTSASNLLGSSRNTKDAKKLVENPLKRYNVNITVHGNSYNLDMNPRYVAGNTVNINCTITEINIYGVTVMYAWDSQNANGDVKISVTQYPQELTGTSEINGVYSGGTHFNTFGFIPEHLIPIDPTTAEPISIQITANSYDEACRIANKTYTDNRGAGDWGFQFDFQNSEIIYSTNVAVTCVMVSYYTIDVTAVES